MKKWWVIGAATVMVLAIAGGGVVWWYAMQTGVKNVVGSPTVEFHPEAPPAPVRPPKAVLSVPWPTYGYDAQRDRVAPFGNKPPYRRLWVYPSGNILEFPPIVARGRLIGTQERGVAFALDTQTGKPLWIRKFGHCAASSPAAAGGIVYLSFMQAYPCPRYPRTQAGLIVAIRISDGSVLWRYHTPVVESSLLLVDGVLYYGGWDQAVYALDVRTRTLLWSYRTDGEIDSSVAFAHGTVFVANNAGSVYALDSKTGRFRWRAQSFSSLFRGREYFYATPAVAYGRVYASNTDGTVYAYGATTGHLLWARHVGTYVYTAPAIWKQKVYVGTYDGKFYALDAATGEVRWVFDAPASIHGAPTVMAGLIYFATCGTCGQHGVRYAKLGPRRTYALDARTGAPVWTFPDGQYSPVVADAKRLYLIGRVWIYGLAPR